MSSGEYEIEATSRTPMLIIYLLDMSLSMNQPLGSKRRIEVITEALESAINSMVGRATKGSIISPRYRIAMLAYSTHVYDLLDGIKPINELARMDIPELKPRATTETAKAFEQARKILRKELPNLQACPVPLVCHLTDGENTGDDPEPIVRDIMQMAVPDGNVLVENIFISDELLPQPLEDIHHWPGVTPKTRFKNAFAQKLKALSSPLPGSYRKMMLEMGYAMSSDALMMIPGTASELVGLGFQMSTWTKAQ
jgi:uncharacterized protein YegL